MIAAFNAAKATITIPAATIELKPGEQYAHLVAAASAYEKHASRARHLKPRAVADALFTTRLNDFKQAAARAQAACQKLTLKENK